MQDVRLSDVPFAPGEEIDRFAALHAAAGGIVSFTGQVREGGGCEALELSHYAPLTLPGMEALAGAAMARWALSGILIIHRVGVMLPGEPIVLVLASSSHRAAAFAAADFVMDFLKTRAPFWKKEHRRDGSTGAWVEAREADDIATARWQAPPSTAN